jgi:hypothetical protein
MKKISVVVSCLILLAVVGCGGSKWAISPQLSPEQQKVTSVSDTSKCKFIKAAYQEVSAAHRLSYFITQATLDAGGDSYKILATSNEKVAGMNIMMVNFEIYKCNP